MTARASSRTTLVLLALLAISGCEDKSAGSTLSADLPLAETVNGQRVPQVLLDVLARERKLDLSVPEQRARAVLELTDYILLDQATRAESYMKDPTFAAAVEINRLQGQANAAMGKFRDSAQVDDSVLRTEYQQQIAKAGTSEYDFSQLLFDNEDDALKAAGEALSKPFNEVFDAWSKRAKQARAFQRVRPAQLPELLGKELSSLKSGETGKIPVHTEYGWHVIHVGAISPFVPPTFEQLKDGIRDTVLAQIGQKRLEKLRSEASITTPEPATPAAASAEKPAN
ncbi:MAG TPA: peptidylprolyl isomerase [Dokdonella sp.]|uniref:peptidylprolyl isomerase n=1 Tax=Dokdonella sp. TaxID=2291710 RepID=UPI002BE40F29|nr:peptidylprolyl isomerase [Dokdonella sp.]HOX71606.1 peptidylprolyl isomerase [Dokdonella sp.]